MSISSPCGSLMTELSNETSEQELEYYSFGSTESSRTAVATNAESQFQTKSPPHSHKLTRAKAIFKCLPKDIFQIPGSSVLWLDLIGQPANETMISVLMSRIRSFSFAQKYAFAELLVNFGLDIALSKTPTPDMSAEVANLHPQLITTRKFVNSSVQV